MDTTGQQIPCPNQSDAQFLPDDIVEHIFVQVGQKRDYAGYMHGDGGMHQVLVATASANKACVQTSSHIEACFLFGRLVVAARSACGC